MIGVALGDFAKAYDFGLASASRIVNDRVGEEPIAIFADPETRDVRVYLRRVAVGDDGEPVEVLFQTSSDGQTVDTLTESVWDEVRGVSTAGRLKGTVLQQVPYVTAFDWAWADFFPHTTFYEG